MNDDSSDQVLRNLGNKLIDELDKLQIVLGIDSKEDFNKQLGYSSNKSKNSNDSSRVSGNTISSTKSRIRNGEIGFPYKFEEHLKKLLKNNTVECEKLAGLIKEYNNFFYETGDKHYLNSLLLKNIESIFTEPIRYFGKLKIENIAKGDIKRYLEDYKAIDPNLLSPLIGIVVLISFDYISGRDTIELKNPDKLEAFIENLETIMPSFAEKMINLHTNQLKIEIAEKLTQETARRVHLNQELSAYINYSLNAFEWSYKYDDQENLVIQLFLHKEFRLELKVVS